MNYFGRLVVVTLAGWLALPAPADACSCMTSAPCQSLWSGPDSPNVFEATVASIERQPATTEQRGNVFHVIEASRVIAHLSDVRGLLGKSGDTVVTSPGGGDCGYQFESGRRYVIHAQASSHGLSVSLCSQTTPIEKATALLAYIASLSQPSAGARVTGKVLTGSSVLAGQDRPRGTSGVVMRLHGPDERTAATAADGTFSFDALPPGQYSLTAVSDASQALVVRDTAEFTLPNPHACYEAYVVVEMTSLLEGTVIDARGRPVGGARVAARRADARGQSVVKDAFDASQQYETAATDEFGRFVFTNVPPGRYVVGLNLDTGVTEGVPYLPVFARGPNGQPEVVELPLGGQHQFQPITALLPSRVMLSGRVVFADGRPAEKVRVFAWAQGESGGFGERVDAVSDDTGRFEFALADGQPYRLNAGSYPGPEAELAVRAAPGDVTLVLRPRPDEDRARR